MKEQTDIDCGLSPFEDWRRESDMKDICIDRMRMCAYFSDCLIRTFLYVTWLYSFKNIILALMIKNT